MTSSVSVYSDEAAKFSVHLLEFQLNNAIECCLDFVVERVAVDACFYGVCANISMSLHPGEMRLHEADTEFFGVVGEQSGESVERDEEFVTGHLFSARDHYAEWSDG